MGSAPVYITLLLAVRPSACNQKVGLPLICVSQHMNMGTGATLHAGFSPALNNSRSLRLSQCFILLLPIHFTFLPCIVKGADFLCHTEGGVYLDGLTKSAPPPEKRWRGDTITQDWVSLSRLLWLKGIYIFLTERDVKKKTWGIHEEWNEMKKLNWRIIQIKFSH